MQNKRVYIVAFFAFSLLGGYSKEFEIPEIVGMAYEDTCVGKRLLCSVCR